MTSHPDSYVQHIETPTNGRVLVRPPRGTSIGGILVGFHGYAEPAEVQLERMASIPEVEDWVLASVQALNRFYRGRTEDTVASWMTRQDRDLTIPGNVTYVDRVVEWLRKQYELDAAKPSTGHSFVNATVPLLYAGFSQGTAMAFRAAVRGRWGADGVIGVGGDVPPELLADPNSRFPAVLLVRGQRDEWYTQAKFDTDVSALEARGVAVTPIVVDAAHEWTPVVASHATKFIQTVS